MIKPRKHVSFYFCRSPIVNYAATLNFPFPQIRRHSYPAASRDICRRPRFPHLEWCSKVHRHIERANPRGAGTWDDISSKHYFCSDLRLMKFTTRPRLVPSAAGIIAIAEINEALNSSDYRQTLAALLLPTAKLRGVNPATGKHYYDVLKDIREDLREVTRISFRLPLLKCSKLYSKLWWIWFWLSMRIRICCLLWKF